MKQLRVSINPIISTIIKMQRKSIIIINGALNPKISIKILINNLQSEINPLLIVAGAIIHKIIRQAGYSLLLNKTAVNKQIWHKNY